MAFKLMKTFDAEINANGMLLGRQEVTTEITYSISVIQLVADGRGIATVCASIGDSAPSPVDAVAFTYEMNSEKGIFEQAEDQVMASKKYFEPEIID
ncbi:hypothetical protein [Serratia fonticola]